MKKIDGMSYQYNSFIFQMFQQHILEYEFFNVSVQSWDRIIQKDQILIGVNGSSKWDSSFLSST